MASSNSNKMQQHKIDQKNLMKKKKRKPRCKQRGISFDYRLFLYRQELRRANTDFSYLRLSRAKIILTAELIARHTGSSNKLSSLDDLKMLSREVQFKKRLCNQVERLEQFQQLGLTDVVLNGKKTAL